MSEIFGAINLKNKIAIVSSLAIFALFLATTIGVVTIATADSHPHVYDYALEMGDDGSFTLTGVCKVANCENPYFREDNLSGVKLFSAISPTCLKEGNRVYTYTHNGVTVKYTEELPVAAHNYNYEKGTVDGAIYLQGRCTVIGCGNTVFVNNIEEIRLSSVVEGTCFSPRVETYVYVKDGEEHSFTTLVDENVPHTINGRPSTDFADDDGNYPIGTTGVKLFENKKLACGAITDGYFVCEKCKAVEPVRVIRPDHEFLYKEENVVAPTPETEGKVTLVCHNTECKENIEVILPPVMNGQALGDYTSIKTEASELRPQIVKYSYQSAEYGFTFEREYQIGEKLSHDYKYKLEPNKVNHGEFDLVGVCSQPECQLTEIRIEDVPAVFVSDTSTCQVPGFVTWSYDHNGETLYFTAPSLKVSEHSYTYYEDRAIHPSLTKAGLIEIFCSTEGCDHSLTIELPKAVVGENAIYISETDIGEVYEYSYETEYNCTIVLNIIIYKK